MAHSPVQLKAVSLFNLGKMLILSPLSGSSDIPWSLCLPHPLASLSAVDSFLTHPINKAISRNNSNNPLPIDSYSTTHVKNKTESTFNMKSQSVTTIRENRDEKYQSIYSIYTAKRLYSRMDCTVRIALRVFLNSSPSKQISSA